MRTAAFLNPVSQVRILLGAHIYDLVSGRLTAGSRSLREVRTRLLSQVDERRSRWLPSSMVSDDNNLTSAALHVTLSSQAACPSISGVDYARFVGGDDQLGPVARAKFGKEPGDVGLGRKG